MGQAYFPCRYTGTIKVPEWNIISNNGVARQYTATTLPPFHYFNGTGLFITKIATSQNLTTYNCFFELNRAGFYKFVSTNGTLTLLTPVIFTTQGIGDIKSSDVLQFIEGIGDSYITISKSGYTDLTFIVTLQIELMLGNLEGIFSNRYYFY